MSLHAPGLRRARAEKAAAEAKEPLRIRWRSGGGCYADDHRTGKAPALEVFPGRTLSLNARRGGTLGGLGVVGIYLGGTLVHEVPADPYPADEHARWDRFASAKAWAQEQVERWVAEARQAEADQAAAEERRQVVAAERAAAEERRTKAAAAARSLAQALQAKPELVQASDALTLARLVLEAGEGL